MNDRIYFNVLDLDSKKVGNVWFSTYFLSRYSADTMAKKAAEILGFKNAKFLPIIIGAGQKLMRSV